MSLACATREFEVLWCHTSFLCSYILFLIPLDVSLIFSAEHQLQGILYIMLLLSFFLFCWLLPTMSLVLLPTQWTILELTPERRWDIGIVCEYGTTRKSVFFLTESSFLLQIFSVFLFSLRSIPSVYLSWLNASIMSAYSSCRNSSLHNLRACKKPITIYVMTGYFLHALRVCSKEFLQDEYAYIMDAFSRLRYPPGMLLNP